LCEALENGYIDVNDLKAKASQHANNLAGIMITYPSTYGVYEETVKEITDIVHRHSGQVYMDGANMNAQVGLTAPGLIGADVCHLNLHKTFSIPHGVADRDGPYLLCKTFSAFFAKSFVDRQSPIVNGKDFHDSRFTIHAVSAAPYGSASILLYQLCLHQDAGKRRCEESKCVCNSHANYMRARLENDYDILYLGTNGTCAHEFIVDLRPFKKSAEIEAEDIAKRLIRLWLSCTNDELPCSGTIMIEPTESEDKAELDRFVMRC